MREIKPKPLALNSPKRPKLHAPCPDACCCAVLPHSQHRTSIAGSKSRPWRKSGLQVKIARGARFRAVRKYLRLCLRVFCINAARTAAENSTCAVTWAWEGTQFRFKARAAAPLGPTTFSGLTRSGRKPTAIPLKPFSSTPQQSTANPNLLDGYQCHARSQKALRDASAVEGPAARLPVEGFGSLKPAT